MILRLLSPNLAAMLPPPPLKPPVQIPLPELDPTAVRAFLVHLYSSDPADLVEGLDPGTWKPAVDRLQAVLKLGGVTPDGDRVLKDELESRLKEVLDATIGPPDDPASSLPTIQEDDEFDAEADEPSSKPAQPAKPPSEFSKALAALRSLDPPQGMLAAPLLLSALSQRPPLTAGQLSRITAGLDFDVARQGTALEWPGGEIQKFHWVKGWIESNGVARRSAECKELGGYVRLEKIGLDDLEGVVEVSFEQSEANDTLCCPLVTIEIRASGSTHSPLESSRSRLLSGSTPSWPAACERPLASRNPAPPKSRNSNNNNSLNNNRRLPSRFNLLRRLQRRRCRHRRFRRHKRRRRQKSRDRKRQSRKLPAP